MIKCAIRVLVEVLAIRMQIRLLLFRIPSVALRHVSSGPPLREMLTTTTTNLFSPSPLVLKKLEFVFPTLNLGWMTWLDPDPGREPGDTRGGPPGGPARAARAAPVERG